jgi:hypothetical protein
MAKRIGKIVLTHPMVLFDEALQKVQVWLTMAIFL